jgi:hypothetical protein
MAAGQLAVFQGASEAPLSGSLVTRWAREAPASDPLLDQVGGTEDDQRRNQHGTRDNLLLLGRNPGKAKGILNEGHDQEGDQNTRHGAGPSKDIHATQDDGGDHWEFESNPMFWYHSGNPLTPRSLRTICAIPRKSASVPIVTTNRKRFRDLDCLTLSPTHPTRLPADKDIFRHRKVGKSGGC